MRLAVQPAPSMRTTRGWASSTPISNATCSPRAAGRATDRPFQSRAAGDASGLVSPSWRIRYFDPSGSATGVTAAGAGPLFRKSDVRSAAFFAAGATYFFAPDGGGVPAFDFVTRT